MTTTTNATHTGNVHVTAAGQDSVEHVVGDCDVTITPNGTVDITVDLWLSASAFGVYKYLVGQVRRDSVTGASLASYAFGYPAGDSNLGHDLEWSTTFTDSAPTTGRYVLTAQSTPNASDVYSDTHVLTLTTPNGPSVTAPVATVAVSAPVPTLSLGTPGVAITAPAATVAVTAPAPTLRVTTPLRAWTAERTQQDTIELIGGGLLTLDVPVVDPPQPIELIRRMSLVWPDPSLDSTAHPIDWAPDYGSSVIEEWGREQVIIGGKDVTYFRGIETQIVSWASREPFGDWQCEIAFPQIMPFEHIGVGALAWLKDGQHITINKISPLGVKTVLWTGLKVSTNDYFSPSANPMSGFMVTGIGPAYQADLAKRVAYIDMLSRDIGTIIPDVFNKVISRDYHGMRKVYTGIPSNARGNGQPVATGYAQDLLATATTADGSNQWTVKQTGWNLRLELKDITTVHATFSPGAAGVDTSGLSIDATQGWNVIKGEGTAPDGGFWRNYVYPNLRTSAAPAYPGTAYHPGDATTGFGVFADEMRAGGYNMASGDTYSTSDEDEVQHAQLRAALTVDGIVGPATWAALFAEGLDGGDLTGSYQAPLWADPRVEPYLYNARGQQVGANPAYEPDRLRVEKYNLYGDGITKREAKQSARAEGARGYSGYSGTITVTADPEEMSLSELKAGMNLVLRNHRGANRRMHIAEVDINRQSRPISAALTVDEHNRDLLTLAQIRSRNKDAANDPAGRVSTSRRLSRSMADNIIPFDSESGGGMVWPIFVPAHTWTSVRCVGGYAADISKSELTSSDGGRFAAGIAVAPISRAFLDKHVGTDGNPLANDSAWSADADALAEAGLIMAWGSFSEPCGYYPGTHANGDPVTGRLVDGATWNFQSPNAPWYWLLLYSLSDTTISGRFYAAPPTG